MARQPSSTDRGYGAAHRAERAKWAKVIATGDATCVRCEHPIAPTDPWDLGHSDDRKSWSGPEHASCNRSAGGRNGNRIARERAQMVRRDWF